jgi:PBP1b-binding outer membrane lipoprotein LpoB
MNIFTKILFLLISVFIAGCSSKGMKPYAYDQPNSGRPFIHTDTADYQKCLNNSDYTPSMTGRY